MISSGRMKTLAALLAAMSVGAGLLNWLETDPARPTVPLPLQAAASEGVNGPVNTVHDTGVPLLYIKWSNVVIHDAGRDGPEAAHGCHFLIGSSASYGDGAVVPTQRWQLQRDGDHVSVPGYSYDKNSIGVCLLADSRQAPATPKQFASLLKLVRSLQVTFQIPRDKVYLHADLAEAGCPGRQFPAERFRHGLMRSAR